jgi:hypothetical protein
VAALTPLASLRELQQLILAQMCTNRLVHVNSFFARGMGDARTGTYWWMAVAPAEVRSLQCTAARQSVAVEDRAAGGFTVQPEAAAAV